MGSLNISLCLAVRQQTGMAGRWEAGHKGCAEQRALLLGLRALFCNASLD